MFSHKKYSLSILTFLFLVRAALTQECPKDSNYLSLTYHGINDNYVVNAVADQQDEIAALGRHSVFNSFVSKYTSQGGIIWSNEYYPDYPHDSWDQFPWYSNTKLTGITAGPGLTTYVFGSTVEHGKSINNVEDPPTHMAGLISKLDKFGNVISSEYIGNWRTDYAVNGLLLLDNGNRIVYLRSYFEPYISKVLCLSPDGVLLWAEPLKSNNLFYKEETRTNPIMKQLKNGNILVAEEMVRNIADTLFMPFMPAIILPAPLHYFNIVQLSGVNGKLLWQRSYQCPTIRNTNVAPGFVPEVKSITELPDGRISLCADMYWPQDNVRFYAHKVFSRRAVNFIMNADGYVTNCIAYYPENNSCSLESSWPTGDNGDQILTVRDSTAHFYSIFKIDFSGKILWSKAYTTLSNNPELTQVAMEKNANKGFFIFQGSSLNSTSIDLTITNAAGDNQCSQIPVTMLAKDVLWTWLVDKVHFSREDPIIDFRISPFSMTKKTYPLSQNINCQYQFICCKDVIDSINTHQVDLCENETYRLPDNTLVKDSGTYYIKLKTTSGCDSVVYYKVRLLKSPSRLVASEDTCLNNSPSIELRATAGFDSYLWNNSSRSSEPTYTVHTSGNYTVMVQNTCGIKTDTVSVYENCNFPIYVPSAFTPNNDGLNDIFRIPRQNKNRFRHLTIYNRWGQLIFSTTDPNNGWNGSHGEIPQPTGIYIYIVRMKGLSGKPIDQKGTVTLIR